MTTCGILEHVFSQGLEALQLIATQASPITFASITLSLFVLQWPQAYPKAQSFRKRFTHNFPQTQESKYNKDGTR
eukprot:693274-Amphidinium_carterae.2